MYTYISRHFGALPMRVKMQAAMRFYIYIYIHIYIYIYSYIHIPRHFVVLLNMVKIAGRTARAYVCKYIHRDTY